MTQHSPTRSELLLVLQEMEATLSRELGSEYNPESIKRAISNRFWQERRIEMLGQSLAYKVQVLQSILEHRAFQIFPQDAKIAVLNYLYALKRGGLRKEVPR